MLLVAGLTLVGVAFTQRQLSAGAERELQASVERQLAAAAHTRRIRQAVLLEICDSLAREPRIHAALEDNAIDLLYPSARHELWQLMRDRATGEPAAENIQARFYRFLDARGMLIPPGAGTSAGVLGPEAEARLTLPAVPPSEQLGYLHLQNGQSNPGVVEVLTVPIISTETFLPIAALVVGFPFEANSNLPEGNNFQSGTWIDGQLVIDGFDAGARRILRDAVAYGLDPTDGAPSSKVVRLDGIAHRVVVRPLNPGSAYPPAHEVFIASLEELALRQERMRARIFGLALAFLLLGLALSHFIARRLARPVEALAEASEEEHVQRVRAETALDHTNRELERAARFSADASHQLKTPVAVMRAGLEELLVDRQLPPNLRDEVKALIRQTGRLTSVIEDLLLLSRLDTGHFHLALQSQNLRLLVDGLLDDLSILPEADQLMINVSIDESLMVQGDRCYTSLILQNLLENARKYNRPGGRIRIVAEARDTVVSCRIGNNGPAIHPATQAHIFERFHRGAAGETVPGYGLGLNLAQELALRHGGVLCLLHSENDWTEFELVLQNAAVAHARAEA